MFQKVFKYSLIAILLIKLIFCKIDKFKKFDGLRVNSHFDSIAFISSQTGLSKLGCIGKCSFHGSCFVTTYFENNSCIFYNEFARYLLVDSKDENSVLHVKEKWSIIGYNSKYTLGLKNYLPFDYSGQDVIDGKNLSIKLNGGFTSDRFNKLNSAILFNLGYGQFPSGTYFSSEGFTFMIWFKYLSINFGQRIIDFGNGFSDNLFIFFHQETDKLRLLARYGSEENRCASSSLPLGQWTHISATFTKQENKNTFVLYVNAVEICQFERQFKDVIRNNNYLGKSNYPEDSNVHAAFDEMKIFDRPLTVSEIEVEMNKVAEVIYGQILHVLQTGWVLANGLVHYWPFSGSTLDIVGSKHMVIKEHGELINDRFNNKESALVFNLGYGQFPSGTYFSSEGFTFMIWFKYLSINFGQRIIDFGNGFSDNLFIFFHQETDKLRLLARYGSEENRCASSSLPLGQWTHISATFTKQENKNTFVLYVNAVEICQFERQFKDVIRNNNYLGKSNYPEDSNVHAAFDEMKIFDRPLTVSEIEVEMDKPQPFEIIQF